MSRSASTEERTELIKNKLTSDNCKAEMIIEYYQNEGWNVLEDLDVKNGIQIKKSAKNYKYANFGLTPLASTIAFDVVNKNGEYSVGSGTTKEGILDLDTKIRVRSGYVLDDLSDVNTDNFNLNSFYTYNFNTKYDSGTIVPDVTNSDGNTDKYFSDYLVPLYDSETYDDSNYSPDAYTIQVYDLLSSTYSNIVSFTINANNALGKIYYRLSNVPNPTSLILSDWTDTSETTINGDKTITVDQNNYRYLQVAVVYDGISWGDDLTISSISISKQDYVEWLYYDVFYLDTPSFSENNDPEFSMVSCDGRDVWKRAIETSINLQDLSSGVSIDQLIKDICDVVGITYTSTSIASLVSFGNRVLSFGLGDEVAVSKIFDSLMTIINKYGYKYQMYIEYDATEDENVLYVQPTPETYLTDFVFDYNHYTSIGSQRKNYDKLLKRITVLSDQQVVDAEEQLVSNNYTSSGQKTISWSGDAEYKRYKVVLNSGSLPTITLDNVGPDEMIFTLGTGTFDLNINVYGNKWSSTAPSYEGEWISHDNIINDKGSTSKLINELIISDTECQMVAKGLIEKFGSPVSETFGLTYPYLNLLLEINDMTLLWSRYIFNDDLRYITGITYKWDYSNSPNDSTVFNLNDSGLNFSDISTFIYDDVMTYDVGYLYDMMYSNLLSDAEVETQTEANFEYNLGAA